MSWDGLHLDFDSAGLLSCCHVFQCAQGNHIFTSGSTGTNAAVIKGALRAEGQQHLLTVILPQSLHRQPSESQELLQQVRDSLAYVNQHVHCCMKRGAS
jgi:cysteine sulfinate desulfinase/cysteine desulfurase-like protein